MYLTHIKGIGPLLMSILFIVAAGYGGVHKFNRLKLYNIGRVTGDAQEAKQKKLPVFKVLMLLKNRFMKDKLAMLSHNMLMFGFILFFCTVSAKYGPNYCKYPCG